MTGNKNQHCLLERLVALKYVRDSFFEVMFVPFR